jgi:eukaryotic-like serine/threonine-protein kinase
VAESPDPKIGAVLEGRYRILQRIAAGGMGSVYKGERLQLGRAVAIKFLHSWVAGHPEMIERFNREARAMSRLSHPSCVSVIDFGLADGIPYLVMEYATGRTLRAVLKEDGRIAPARAIAVARQLLAGLAHAHGHEIVHRDVKPDNVVLGEVTGLGVHVRILDFGIAKLRDLQSGLTVGFAVGTPSYMAPEQIAGEAVDARTDVYATGAVLFELLTGRKLFDGDSSLEILRMQRETPPPRLRDAQPNGAFSGDLEAAVARALAKAPRDRYASAAEMAAALERTPEAAGPPLSAGGLPAIREPSPSQPAPVGPPTVVARKRGSRGPALPVAVAAILLVGGSVAAWHYVTQGANVGAHGNPPHAAATEIAAGDPHRPVPVIPRNVSTDVTAAGDPPSRGPEPSTAGQPTEDVPGLAEARALARSGRFKAAVDRLKQLRKRHPDDPEIAYLLANVYLGELWGDEGFEAARAAVRLDPAYRRDPTLIKNAVNALVSDRHAGRATRFIREEIGEAARPHLEQARRSRSLNISRRAAALLRSLESAR